MILANKKEAAAVRKAAPSASIRKTCHNYYIEESPEAMRVLNALRTPVRKERVSK